ncbi:solute carrier family member 1 [Moniliophthora roreri MCA 2997]|uniref:Solute carrier family member 1 n=1 Tax=Moniliophthora roreri (strain MCA 2997) TaxID=1381753 RepID=V2WLK0_MONRO|nr:solute carrier family member 1 [Moniliophthora roreri MCA 2997]
MQTSEIGSSNSFEGNERDDIELSSLRHYSGSPPESSRLHQNARSYDLEDGDDDDEEALLGSRGDSRRDNTSQVQRHKRWPQVKNIVIESAPTLLFTTLGLLFTGKLLDQVSRWQPMQVLDQLIITIPVILNLKGNLEMNLSARLATAANSRQLGDRRVKRKIILGNLALLQVQAGVVSLVAAGVAFVLGFVLPKATPGQEQIARAIQSVLLRRRPLPHKKPDTSRKLTIPALLTVLTTCILSASLSSILLGSLMSGIVLLCLHFSLDPDNIAPPVASCLGDLVTLCLIGVTSTILVPFMHTPSILEIPLVMLLVLGLLLAVWVSCLLLTLKNSHVRPLLTQGWSPLFGAMIISSGTGIVLDLFVSRYEGFALLAVVISGLPGAVGAIFTSRLSTALHLESVQEPAGESPPAPTRTVPSPKLVMITLLLITLPVELIFLSILRGFGWLRLPLGFVSFSVVFFCTAVLLSLFLARGLTTFLWRRGRDPDIYALPIHSSAMDLIGQSLLVVCFEIVRRLGLL